MINSPDSLLLGDCLEVLKTLPEDSIDALVTDPPAGISFMGKSWDGNKGGRKEWCAWMESVMRECLRVMKPGAHGLVWALPRTSHWTATALEDAGFEVRDCITHLFGSGFPKSLDVSKAIDKAAGAERTETYIRPDFASKSNKKPQPDSQCISGEKGVYSKPATDAAKQWQGFGTALKPAAEFWYLVRKPISEKTVAANVLKWGTGGLNIDGTRIGTSKDGDPNRFVGQKKHSKSTYAQDSWTKEHYTGLPINLNQGRFPSNLILSHTPYCEQVGVNKVKGSNPVKTGGGVADKTYGITNKIYSPLDNKKVFDYTNPDGTETVEAWECADDCPVAMLDAQSGVSKSTGGRTVKRGGKYQEGKVSALGEWTNEDPGFGDTGGASRFFYCAKVSSSERNAGLKDFKYTQEVGGQTVVNANNHPTVKPQKLMRYLCRLVTPPKGVILDPFMGSGSTGLAAKSEGFRFIGIEREPEYFEIAKVRIGQNAI